MYIILLKLHHDGDSIWQSCVPILGMRWEEMSTMSTFRSALCTLPLVLMYTTSRHGAVSKITKYRRCAVDVRGSNPSTCTRAVQLPAATLAAA